MTLYEKNIGDYRVALNSVSNVYVVSVRCCRVTDFIFFRQYNDRGSARRSYNAWCVKVDNINRCEVTADNVK